MRGASMLRHACLPFSMSLSTAQAAACATAAGAATPAFPSCVEVLRLTSDRRAECHFSALGAPSGSGVVVRYRFSFNIVPNRDKKKAAGLMPVVVVVSNL